MSNQRDWAYLFPEAIDTIAKKLDDSFSAFMTFISVCQHWRTVASKGTADRNKKNESDNMQKLEILRTCGNQLPLLVVETQVQSYKVSRCFFTGPSVDGNGGRISYYQLKNQHHLPPPGSISYFGSSFGWLLAQKEESSSLPMVDIALFNPLTGAVKCLPPRWSSEDEGHSHRRCRIGDCDKGVLSSDPSKEDGGYELVVIHDEFRRLACYRERTNSWMTIKAVGRVVDAIFYKGKVYAVTDLGDLLQVDFDTTEITRVVVASGFDRIPLQNSCKDMLVTHLVVSKHGQYLLMVEQIDVKYFKVFKLCCEKWTWVEVINDLGVGVPQALFVGSKTSSWDRSCFSASVSTVEFPQCEPNCIYYTYGSHIWNEERRGVFNLELKQHFQMPLKVGGAGVGYSSTQIWMVPNFK